MRRWNVLGLGMMLAVGLSASCSRKEKAPEKPAESSAPAAASGMPALLPADPAVAGWALEGTVRYFTEEDLFELINGAAESYFVYGFRAVAAAEYRNPAHSSPIVLELYRMKDARNAFGIYRSELYPDADFRPIGVEGYVGETGLNFWAGPYYAKLAVHEESDALEREMEQFARRLAERIGDPGGLPPEVALFPARDLVPYSERYLPTDVLGQNYLVEAFEAKYRSGGGEGRVVLLAPGDEAAAREAMEKYRRFTAAGGEVLRELSSPGNGGFVGRDAYYGPMAALRSGGRIAIALGGPSTEYALGQAAACLAQK